LTAAEKTFNTAAVPMRVMVEHAFGMVKGRFQSLKELRTKLREESDLQRATFWIEGCTVLHNVLIDLEGDDFWADVDQEQLYEQWHQEAEVERQAREAWEATVDLPALAGVGNRRKGNWITWEFVRHLCEQRGYQPVYPVS
jgi:hypothetical protein